MILFLYGKDTFRSRQQLHKMLEKFKKERDPSGYNVSRINILETKNPMEVMEQILAIPFLAERRMVVLENLLQSKSSELQKEILRRASENKLPESNILIFWEGDDVFKGKDAKALAERLQAEKFAQRFDELKGPPLARWIEEEVKSRGGRIQAQAVMYLVNELGGDIWRVNSLLEQLIAYCSQNEISRSDIQLFLNEGADENIFNLVDAIVAKQSRDVFQMIQEQYRMGEDAQYIYAMLIRQFRILLELRDIFEREDNVNSDDMAKRTGLHPFVVKKSLPLIKRYTMPQLRGVHDKLLDLDVRIKTSSIDDRALLDIFVGNVCLG